MPSKTVLRKDDLHPDGVRISVNWDNMVVGASIFIPCIDTETAAKQVSTIFSHKKWCFNKEIRVENGKFGLRIWRVT